MARDFKSAKDLVVEPKHRKYIVRRLTPTECARLQGFPDLWCEGLGGSDSAIYKAYGNGLALPCAYDVLCRIANFIKEENT
jgi:site-specific DNA-cytosine methylase